MWLYVSSFRLCVRVCVVARARARVCVCVCVGGGGGGGGYLSGRNYVMEC